MKEREALKLSREVIEHILKFKTVSVDDAKKTLDLINEQLAQPEQEPVAWANRVIGGKKWLSIHASKGASDRWLEYRIKEQAQGEEYEQVSLYTTPPQRTWVGLTDEEVESTFWPWKERTEYIIPLFEYREICQIIEAKLKEKNT